MLGTSRLLAFALRALVLLLLVSMLWISVAKRYNEGIISLARPLLPDDVSIRVLGSHILVENQALVPSLSIDALTLHSGLVLMVVLVLAAVGVGVRSRLAWLLAMVCGAFLLHIVGVALLSRGVVWAASASAPSEAGRLVFSLFAVFWGLLPAVMAGLWCFLYWIPRLRGRSPTPQGGRDAFRETLSSP